MKYDRWRIAPGDASAVSHLMDAGYPYLVSSVLVSRGISTPEAAAEFLQQERSLSHDPFLMRDMDKAVDRISRALADGEKIGVFGDYDVDGITSTVLLSDYLRSRGADVEIHIPCRVEEGYGLSKDALQSLFDRGVSLVVTVDCGITGVEETDFAKSLGMDLVITDHHECKETLPAAVAVVDPHRPDCPYPFKQLAGVGVALKLVLALGGHDREGALFARYCTLAAIGTIADVMRMEDENRAIVQCGLETFDRSDFIGLHALLREAGLAGKALTSTQIGFVLAPRINAAGRMGRAEVAVDLLLTSDPAQAEKLAHDLCELNAERRSVEQEIFARALEQLESLPKDERNALVLASDEWHQGVVGIVASRLSEKYSCPSFMIHLSGGIGKGSCRSYGGFNLFASLEACGDLLLGFGGHELAAGFSIEEKNIPAFRKRMNQYVRAHVGEMAPVSSLDVDVDITLPSHIDLDEIAALDCLEPFGSGNERPVFCLRGMTLENMQNIGQNKHLKVFLQKQHQNFEGIFFSAVAEDFPLRTPCRVDAAFYLQINEFRGNRSVQFQLVDMRPSPEPSAREKEAADLCVSLREGLAIAPKDAARMLPSREQFVRLWRTLEKMPQPISEAEFPLLRRLSSDLSGAESFLRTMVCLFVFQERGLLCCTRQEESLVLQCLPSAEKTALEESPYLIHLRNAMDP